jgi:2-polyprenyl-3-methyl-5-hydroxy-6-metoxy-1,4-benzoquinol methylase
MNELSRVEFETVPCGFCGSSNDRPLFSGPDRLLGLPGLFTIVQCQDCGLLRQNPRPTPETIDFYYPADYEPYSIAPTDEKSRWRRWDRRYGLLKRRRAIERYISEGQLLDVGCATGNFLDEMRRSGRWEVKGVEPNREAASYAQQRMSLEVFAGRLEEVELPPASFDVITMWNVLEHLHDPLSSIRAVDRLLKPGGLFVFSIPNMESLEVRAFGHYWLGWELPRHLYFFPRPVLARFLASTHMTVLQWNCLVGAYPSFLLTLRFALQQGQGSTWWTRPLLALARSLPVRALLTPLFYFLTRANRASLITGFARKDLA